MPLRRILFGHDLPARLVRVVLLTALAVTAGYLIAAVPAIELVELKTEDLRYRLRGERPIDDRILVVEIDDATREAFEQFPLERDKYALLSYFTPRFGATGVVYDLFFTEADSTNSGDLGFALVIDDAPDNTTVAIHPVESAYREHARSDQIDVTAEPLPGSIAIEPPGATLRALTSDGFDGPASMFSKALHASATAIESSDGSVRQVPLFVRVGDRFVPTLAVAAWMRLQGLDPSELHIDATTRSLCSADGEEILSLPPDLVAKIPFAGSTESLESHRVGMAEALRVLRRAQSDDATDAELHAARELFAGRVVLVGLTARSSYMVDYGVMPFDSSAPLLFAHVNLLDGLLRGAPLERFPDWISLLGTILFAALGIVLAGRIRPLLLGLVLVVLVGSLLALGQTIFVQTDRMVATIPHLAAVVLAYGGAGVLAFAGEERERVIVRRTFDRYVSPDLLEGIVERAGEIELGGTTRRVTILFLDIRSFSEWSRSIPADELVDELNAFFAEMVDVVFTHGGSVNKFLGDAILAVFGAPVATTDDPDRAVRSAVGMRQRLVAHNVARESLGKAPLRIGIGIATGDVVAGNVGDRRRLEYTVIGDPVNRAARLQSFSTAGQILVDATTAEALRSESHTVKPIGVRALKGLGDVEILEVDPKHA